MFDRTGRFITDLTKEDFRILEDRRRQEVTTLTLVDILSDSTPGGGAPVSVSGRFYVIVLDDLQWISSSGVPES